MPHTPTPTLSSATGRRLLLQSKAALLLPHGSLLSLMNDLVPSPVLKCHSKAFSCFHFYLKFLEMLFYFQSDFPFLLFWISFWKFLTAHLPSDCKCFFFCADSLLSSKLQNIARWFKKKKKKNPEKSKLISLLWKWHPSLLLILCFSPFFSPSWLFGKDAQESKLLIFCGSEAQNLVRTTWKCHCGPCSFPFISTDKLFSLVCVVKIQVFRSFSICNTRLFLTNGRRWTQTRRKLNRDQTRLREEERNWKWHQDVLKSLKARGGNFLLGFSDFKWCVCDALEPRSWLAHSILRISGWGYI